MNLAILVAAVGLAFGAAAAATPTVTSPADLVSMTTATPVSPVSADTCAGLASKYDAAAGAHASSAKLAEADAKAAAGEVACAEGETAEGIAAYRTALRLLGA